MTALSSAAMPAPRPLLAFALALATALAAAVVVVVAAAGCSTTRNPSFCCATPADCEQFGVTDGPRTCAAGTSCVGNTCVRPSCQSQGCAADAPVCDADTDTCGGCDDASDCAGFPDAPVCDAGTGACRACRLDTDCASGACGDDGRCVEEARIVYLAPSGTDAPPCSRAAPCKQLQFAVQQTTPQRDHIVMVSGDYTAESTIDIVPQNSSALAVTVHGAGSTLSGGSSDGFVIVGMPTTIRDLDFLSTSTTGGVSLSLRAATTLDRVSVGGRTAIQIGAVARLRDVEVRASDVGISSTGTLIVERARIIGGRLGIEAFAGSLDITNLMVTGTSDTGIRTTGTTSGSIAFSTIADTGTSSSDNPGVIGSSALTVRSSIVWTPTSDGRAGVRGCNLVSSIVGPVGVVGASSANPLFVSPATGDYRIQGGSPARDAADAGPAVDFEGDPRPRGLRFDLGADETP